MKISQYLKEKFGEKIYKVSLDGGFTCPNRDGKVGYGGCTFCSESGSGEFASKRSLSIEKQIDQQLEFLSHKIKDGKVLAYFQNFTNTYGEIEYLRKIYYEALSHPRVCGIVIGTRADCLSDEIIALLKEISNSYFLWVELGLQTSNDDIAKEFNRGYPFSVYKETTKKLFDNDIKFVTHMIVGLPNESVESIYRTADDIVKSKAWGIKIHSLHILKNTIMEKKYKKNPFKIFTLEEYVDIIVTILKRIPDDMIIHRLTGDGKREDLIEPKWSLNKRMILNQIEKKMRE